MNPAPEHLRFVRQVRRRWIAWQMLERMGIGMVAASAVSLTLMPVLLWRGQATIIPALMFLCLGCAIGMLWSCSTAPTLLQAAMLADRQLGLNDLLSTAITLPTDSSNRWEAMVIAHASSRCHGLGANQVFVRRLGARAWGGIGLVGALPLILALMSSDPLPLAAGMRSSGPIPPIESWEVHQPSGPILVLTQHLAQGLESSDAAWSDLANGDALSRGDRETLSDTGKNISGQNPTDDGRGTASGRSDDMRWQPLSYEGSVAGAQFNLDSPDYRATTSSWGANTPAMMTDSFGLRSDVFGQTASQAPDLAVVPRWRSSRWPATDQSTAVQPVPDQVPDAYRDLVREYFNRTAAEHAVPSWQKSRDQPGEINLNE